jgi:phage gp36-like protein
MGQYIDLTDVENKFGADNIATWSNLDNDHRATVDMARVNVAINYAEEYVQDRMRNGRYTVPFSPLGQMPACIIDWCATKAGAWLYENRGTRDGSPDADFGNRIAVLERRVDAEIDAVLAGTRELQLQSTWPTATAPTVSFGPGVGSRRWPGQR